VFLAIDYYYNRKTIPEDQVDSILDKSIELYLKSKTSEEEFSFELLLPFMTKLHFEKVDKRIEKFGEKWGNYVKSTNDSEEFEFSAFCDLLLNNVSFFQKKVFPNVDLQGIENPLQVAALLEGKYFRYLSTNNFYRDLNFKFE
jgi:hypothetical protein